MDCRELMISLEPASVDSIVTDPPYELGFMGKGWDKSGIAYHTGMWREALRVLKPGGHLLAFGGSRTYHRMACAIEDAGFEIRDQIMWLYGSGFPKSRNLDGPHKGWGTALKPAHEPIVVARKPLIGTVAENVETHGTGAINIDGCRVPTNGEEPKGSGNRDSYRALEGRTDLLLPHSGNTTPIAGRWPANLIHDGSDEVLAAFPEAPGQMANVKFDSEARKDSNVYGAMKRGHEPSANSDNTGTVGFKMKPGARRLDSGSAARFFYCAKASKKDRGDSNNHPTVKPTELMRYLCRLVTPVGGIVLDPFMGSGSTAKACVLEGFKYIGAEINGEYVAIQHKRLQDCVPGQNVERCPYCDDTGDVHRTDGEWLGTCTCTPAQNGGSEDSVRGEHCEASK